VWFYSAKEKLFDQDGDMPAGLAKAYAGDFIDRLPGVNTSWLLLGLLDGLAVLIVSASLLSGESCPAGASRSCWPRWPCRCSRSR
jgi:hypothetical protein